MCIWANVGALKITNAILGVPYDTYSIMNGPQKPILIIKRKPSICTTPTSRPARSSEPFQAPHLEMIPSLPRPDQLHVRPLYHLASQFVGVVLDEHGQLVESVTVRGQRHRGGVLNTFSAPA